MGRPTVRTQQAIDTICERLSAGVPLTVICREGKEADPSFPAPRTVMDWQAEDESVAAAIARAREAGQEALFEQCLEIADDEEHDWELSKKGEVTNEVAIGRAKLRVWTSMELLKRLNPRKYGDKSHIEHSGKVGLESLVAGDE